MKTKMMALALLTLAGTAMAQNSVVSNLPGTFVDISGMGATSLVNGVYTDDTSFPISTSVTNAVFASTDVRICSNGFIQFGGGNATDYTNATIAPGSNSPLTPNGNQALFPYWDDQFIPDGNGGEIYWMEGPAAGFGLPASRGNVLIIQWTNSPHYDAGVPVGAVTYQVQIFQNIVGHVAAQMLYSDISFDDARFDNGFSATIGFAAGSNGGPGSSSNALYAFNVPGSVHDGSVLSVMDNTASVPPSGTGATNPPVAQIGDAVVLAVTVTPGGNPSSTGLAVHGNLTSIGGGANVTFHDDGLNGDDAAGDGIYSFRYVLPAAAPGGTFTVPVTITDAQSRTGNASVSGYIFNPQDLGTLVDGTDVSADVPLGNTEVRWFKATVGDCSVGAGRNLMVTTSNSASGGDSEIGVYDSTGTFIASDDDGGVNAFSLLSFGFQGFNGDIGPGLIYIAVGSFNTNFDSPFSAVSTGPANDFQLDLLQTNSFPPTAVGAATPVDLTTFLMSVTVTSGINPASTGVAVTADLSSIGGSSSQAFFDDGTHGDVASGDGTYTYTFVTSASTPVGPFSVQAAVTDDQNDNLSVTLTGTVVVAPDAVDLGQIGAGAGGSEVVTTHDTDVFPTTITWLKFSIGSDITNDGSGMYLDIDTEPTGGSGSDGTPTVGSINDTELGLYHDTGIFINTDDDDGSDYHSQLSFGDSGSPREQFPGVGNNAVGGNGRDGALTAGTYYLATGCFNAVFNNSFDATTTSNASGTIQVNFRTNIPGGGGSTQCSPADVGIAGGLAGHDHLLNNNDFIAFITLFFANDPQADMGVAGGVPGSDGLWNNNDFIAFISHFFNDAAHCNG